MLWSYIFYGEECPRHLNGIFAFAVYDPGEEKVFLARDRLGVKPLFYTRYGGNFYFSSKMDLWNGARVAAVIPQDSNNPNKEIVAELCVNDGMFATGSFGARPNTGKSTGYYMTVGTQRSTVLICENTDKILMSAAFVSNDYDLENGKKLPAGTIVRIWGLKA